MNDTNYITLFYFDVRVRKSGAIIIAKQWTITIVKVVKIQAFPTLQHFCSDFLLFCATVFIQSIFFNF